MNNSSSWVEIDRAQIVSNVENIRSMIGRRVALAVVIKSNAYGHGIPQVIKILNNHQDVDWFMAYHLSEAVLARKSGCTKPIFICGDADVEISLALEHDIDLTVYDLDQARRCSDIAQKIGKDLFVHIKIDTGLTRLGVLVLEADEFIGEVMQLKNICVRGIFSHFAESNALSGDFTCLQSAAFKNIVDRYNIPLVHIANTVGAIRFVDSRFNMVRVGGGVYGLRNYEDSLNIKPAFAWKTRVLHIKKVPSGSCVGYGRTFKTKRETRVAVLPVGYADGYDRGLSNKGFVYIKNQHAPVIGRICMNMMMVDITDINAMVGDEVSLVGSQSKISISHIAKELNTITYDTVISVNWTIPRKIV